MTKLYFHAASSTVTGTLPSAEQSALTSTKNVNVQTVNRSMNTSISTGTMTTLALTTNATASLTDYYITKFVSDTLTGVSSSITAHSWNYAFAARVNNLSANFPCNGTSQPVYVNVYVWRPSNGTKLALYWMVIPILFLPNVLQPTPFCQCIVHLQVLRLLQLLTEM